MLVFVNKIIYKNYFIVLFLKLFFTDGLKIKILY